MIIGIGTDFVNIDRIAKTLEQFGDRFCNRIFTDIEKERAKKYKDMTGSYAKCWAAKEACSKALGTGISMGISWKDISVFHFASGQPYMKLTGQAKKRLDQLMPLNHISNIHLSLTDDHPWAQAFVVIEALPVSRSC